MNDRPAPDPRRDALAHKLRWYGAAAGAVAGAAALVTAPEAEAQVVSFEFDPVVVVGLGEDYPSFSLDFDGDGDPELVLTENRPGPASFTRSNRNEEDELTGLIGRAANGTFCTYYGSHWDPLDTGVQVSSGNFFFYAIRPDCSYRQLFTYGGSDTFSWIERSPAYAGARFALDGSQHFGWMYLGLPPEGGRIMLYGYAYNATPGAPITTGDTGTAAPAVTLDGSVNQTAFPATGGTLRFTATVTNTTPEPKPLDLWLVARQDGEVVAVRRLGAGTLVAGATRTLTVAQTVPALAPSGAYDVRFHVGRFPAVVDTESFTITKAAGLGDGEGEVFAASRPVVGDLFAGASSDATLAPPLAAELRSHALGAVTPNPSAGQAVFTLEVAEAQAVRVAVYDALGREVALVHDGLLAAGTLHRLWFDGSGLPAGVYAVRAVGASFSDVRTLTLVR